MGKPSDQSVERSNGPITAANGSVWIFFTLAFLITWAVWVPRALGVDWALQVGTVWTYGPLLAAFATALLAGGPESVRLFARSLDRWRLGWRWYALILAGPPVMAALIAALSVWLGATWDESIPESFTAPLPVVFLLVAILSFTDGLGEEVGWRGFALPRLLSKQSALVASVLLGVVWAVWHLPLFFTEGSFLEGSPPWLMAARLPATSIIFTWLYVHTGRSVVAAVLLHATINLFGVTPAVSGDSLTPDLVTLAVHWAIAIALVALAGARGLDRWPRTSMSSSA